jgi:competence protein ComEC
MLVAALLVLSACASPSDAGPRPLDPAATPGAVEAPTGRVAPAAPVPPPSPGAPAAPAPAAPEVPPADPVVPAAPTEVTGLLEVHFLDVGQADATLLRHEDVTILVDAGGHRSDDVLRHLRRLDVRELDLLVLTHPHADHIGQAAQVLEALPVGEVWWSGSVHTTQTFERLVAALERTRIPIEEPRAGQRTRLGPLEIDVLNPGVDVDLADFHDASLSLRIRFGTLAVVLTGDAEAAAERRMARLGLLDADVLKLGHHGSRTSTTPDFLRAVSPRIAIVSAGAGNSYGHPHPEVVERIVTAGITMYATSTHGSIVVTTDGQDVTVGTGRAGAAQALPNGPTAPAVPSTSTGCRADQVDINVAPVGDLQRIRHIGPARAEAVVRLRPFLRVEELRRVDGIGAARLADIIGEGVACVGS